MYVAYSTVSTFNANRSDRTLWWTASDAALRSSSTETTVRGHEKISCMKARVEIGLYIYIYILAKKTNSQIWVEVTASK